VKASVLARLKKLEQVTKRELLKPWIILQEGDARPKNEDDYNIVTIIRA